jgi:zinc transporter 1/2/3
MTFQLAQYDADVGSSSTGSGLDDSPPHRHHHQSHISHTHSHVPVDDEEGVAAAIRNLLIVVAISFHGIFEGMAIGLQGTEKDVWYLFLAVSLHECTILFCIGIELISSKTTVLRMIIYILIVSLVSPIGMAIGIIVSEAQGSADAVGHAILIGSLQGLAAGTLLYVAFFEIFAAEGKALRRKYIHIIVAIIGFLFMGALELVGGHSHGGGHGHSHGGPSPVTAASRLATDDHSDHDHDEHAPNGFHSHEDHDHDHHGHSH